MNAYVSRMIDPRRCTSQMPPQMQLGRVRRKNGLCFVGLPSRWLKHDNTLTKHPSPPTPLYTKKEQADAIERDFGGDAASEFGSLLGDIDRIFEGFDFGDFTSDFS